MRKLLSLLIAGTLLAACSADGADDTTTTTAQDTATTAAPETTTTTLPATTVTTAVSGTTTTVQGALAPGGSGCTPGTAELPDGTWYGLVAGYDSDGIDFDLACWFTGDAAAAAAAEDGEEPPPNDFYVRNENEQIREITVDPSTPVIWYFTGDPADFQEGTFSAWTEFLGTQEFHLGIWLTISDGQVTQIEEQWVP